MFLNQLNLDEKKNYWALINLVVKCDGEFSDKEKNLVAEYQKEMEFEPFENSPNDIDVIISQFTDSSPKVKNIIFLETIALILADEKYEVAEKAIIEKMMVSFGISEEKRVRYFEWIGEIQQLYKKANNLIEF